MDCSQSNRDYIIHIQHSLRLLLEQQLFGRRFFNVIAFGTNHKEGLMRFKPTMVQPTIENLQNAWQWVGYRCFDESLLIVVDLGPAIELRWYS